ncbi:MAG: tetratricopeptide repeat protein, partial [Candidatus Omnitrophica bacterium]|nr:tetratricopeptide repeat protein [Candidatus Omnitrophota bacterium]
ILAYYNRGLAYLKQGKSAQAIPDFNKVIEINPKDPEAYRNRAIAYHGIKEYNKAWEDVHKAEGLGYTVSPKFLNILKEESGRDK